MDGEISSSHKYIGDAPCQIQKSIMVATKDFCFVLAWLIASVKGTIKW